MSLQFNSPVGASSSSLVVQSSVVPAAVSSKTLAAALHVLQGHYNSHNGTYPKLERLEEAPSGGFVAVWSNPYWQVDGVMNPRTGLVERKWANFNAAEIEMLSEARSAGIDNEGLVGRVHFVNREAGLRLLLPRMASGLGSFESGQ